MVNVFTYGSLMFEEVWSRLISSDYKKASATLHGFIRTAVIDETYPVISIGKASDFVNGVVYFDVKKNDIARLDDFEGDYYIRKNLPVQLSDGAEFEAQTYILNKEFSHIVSSEDWDPDHFKKCTMPRFITNYVGFKRQR